MVNELLLLSLSFYPPVGKETHEYIYVTDGVKIVPKLIQVNFLLNKYCSKRRINDLSTITTVSIRMSFRGTGCGWKNIIGNVVVRDKQTRLKTFPRAAI